MFISRLLLAIFFVVAGVNHFVSPDVYLQLIPTFLPARLSAVYISGAAEILGGLGVLLARTRRPAGLGLILLLLVVFPANIFSALHGVALHGWNVPPWILWARLPLQLPLIAWVYFVCWKAEKSPRCFVQS